MPQNFICADREQSFLLPPSLRDWLPADHLAWCVIEAVAEMDLSAFYADYRLDGHGRAAYEPSLMGWIQVVVATPDYGGCGDEDWPSGGAEGAAGEVLGRYQVGVGRGGRGAGCGRGA